MKILKLALLLPVLLVLYGAFVVGLLFAFFEDAAIHH